MSTGNKQTEPIYYTLEDLLQDEYFISSMKSPTPESRMFWEKAMEENRLNREDYRTARHFVGSVQVKRTPLSHDAILELWKNIEIKKKD